MTRMIGAAAVGLLAVGLAQAHFPYLLPEPDGAAVKLVFSDELAPDLKVNIEKVGGTKLTVRDAAGKDAALTAKKGDGCYDAAVPGSGPRVVFGVTDYGVLQKGDAKPFRLVYYPKAALDGAGEKPVGGPLAVEIVAAGGAGKPRFQVLHHGKPAAGVEVSVTLPAKSGEKGDRKAVKTDKDGFTPAFDGAGRYGAWARVTEAKSGEAAGKKFEETRHYATLVIDVK